MIINHKSCFSFVVLLCCKVCCYVFLLCSSSVVIYDEVLLIFLSSSILYIISGKVILPSHGVVVRPRARDAFQCSDVGPNDGLSVVSPSGDPLRRSAGHPTRTALPVRETGHRRKRRNGYGNLLRSLLLSSFFSRYCNI